MREKSFYDDFTPKNNDKAPIGKLWGLLRSYIPSFYKPLVFAAVMLAVAAGLVLGFGKFLIFAKILPLPLSSHRAKSRDQTTLSHGNKFHFSPLPDFQPE